MGDLLHRRGFLCTGSRQAQNQATGSQQPLFTPRTEHITGSLWAPSRSLFWRSGNTLILLPPWQKATFSLLWKPERSCNIHDADTPLTPQFLKLRVSSFPQLPAAPRSSLWSCVLYFLLNIDQRLLLCSIAADVWWNRAKPQCNYWGKLQPVGWNIVDALILLQ